MWHKPCRTFHPWCLCIKTRCLSVFLSRSNHICENKTYIRHGVRMCFPCFKARAGEVSNLPHKILIHDDVIKWKHFPRRLLNGETVLPRPQCVNIWLFVCVCVLGGGGGGGVVIIKYLSLICLSHKSSIVRVIIELHWGCCHLQMRMVLLCFCLIVVIFLAPGISMWPVYHYPISKHGWYRTMIQISVISIWYVDCRRRLWY